ncbi:MAG: M23 family metallopeptidase [Anaerolineae bacterium]|nr:M23 family metallopeptidase [Anaerolineae bacterium]
MHNRSLFPVMLALGGLLLALAGGGLARAQTGEPASAPPVTVTLQFEVLPQGGVGVVQVTGAELAGARARFLNRLIEFYAQDGTWYGLLAANMEQKTGTYPLEILLWFADGSRETWTGEVLVVDGEFIRQDVTIGDNLGYLLEPEVDRAERARLTAIFNDTSATHYWDVFGKPLDSEFTSPFGAWRLYNESLWGRHTGVDLRGPAGTPLLAVAAGRVVLAERLDVRGNYVLIDHGWGVYSGIAHLSEIHVTRGQIVQQGQVIGISGSTGRSSGPHIHWEMAVNGEWIDPQQFLTLEIP